jgi:glutamate synthase domain-containing protein 3
MKTINANLKTLREVNKELKSLANGDPVGVNEASSIHGLAAGLRIGEIIVEGDVGDYLGVLNAGAKIIVTGNSGKYTGDNMTSGEIFVSGNTGFGAGQYCYGGALVVKGNAGDFTATMNKGATIIIGGDVGSEVGTYMLKGDLIILGNAGNNFANYLIRGTIYIAGDWESLGHNTRVDALVDEDIAKLRAYFDVYDIQANPVIFKKIVAASTKPFYN